MQALLQYSAEAGSSTHTCGSPAEMTEHDPFGDASAMSTRPNGPRDPGMVVSDNVSACLLRVLWYVSVPGLREDRRNGP